MCHQNGFTNTVATSGTSLTPQHLEKLKRHTDNLKIVYDADKAGLKATLRAWTGAIALGMNVKIAGLPSGEDPASLLLQDKEAFKLALKNSKHIIDYYIEILSKEGLSDSNFRKAIEREVLPYVAVVDSAIERSNFISKVSVQTGIYESDIREEVEKIRSSPKFIDGDITSSKESTTTYTKDEDSISIIRKAFSSYASDTSTIRRVAGLILWLQSKGDMKKADSVTKDVLEIVSTQDSTFFTEDLKKAPEELIFEAEVLFSGSSRLEEEISELLFGLEERTLKELLSKTMLDLQLAEKKGDKERGEELIKQCQDISLKLTALNKKRNI
jgi:DNA primase